MFAGSVCLEYKRLSRWGFLPVIFVDAVQISNHGTSNHEFDSIWSNDSDRRTDGTMRICSKKKTNQQKIPPDDDQRDLEVFRQNNRNNSNECSTATHHKIKKKYRYILSYRCREFELMMTRKLIFSCFSRLLCSIHYKVYLYSLCI